MKVKCTGYKKDERYFTVGKVYEWKDGEIKNDFGGSYILCCQGKDPDKWLLSYFYKFEVVKEPKFKVGDIVKANEKSNGFYAVTCEKNGFIGKVTKIGECGLGIIFVQGFEKRHKTDNNEGWRVREDYFDLVQEKNEIHITVDGAKTIAVMKSGGKVIRRAEAKCNPSDEFDFKTGAELAFKRIFEEEPKEEKKEEPKDKDFKVGDKVRYIAHDADGKYYPPYGTIGEIKIVDLSNIGVKWNTDKVLHTKACDYWFCYKYEVEKI